MTASSRSVTRPMLVAGIVCPRADLLGAGNPLAHRSPRKNKAHRRDRDLKSHGYWNISFCAMANGAPSQFGVIVVAEDNYRYSRRELR